MDEQFESIYSRKHVASMLLFIAHYGRVKERSLTEVTSNYYTALEVVMVLFEKGFVKKYVDDKGHTTTWWEITDDGLAAADFLKKANAPKDYEKEPEMNCSSSPEQGDMVRGKSS